MLAVRCKTQRNQMNKEQLLDHLTNKVYCRIAPSRIHGVGVVAIKTIPQGINPLDVFEEEIRYTHEELEHLEPGVHDLLTAYCYQDADSVYVPISGLNNIAILRCLNHSSDPNIEFDPVDGAITT